MSVMNATELIPNCKELNIISLVDICLIQIELHLIYYIFLGFV